MKNNLFDLLAVLVAVKMPWVAFAVEMPWDVFAVERQDAAWPIFEVSFEEWR